MGVEIIYPIVWLFSAAAIIWLIIQSIRSEVRPYALPTLLLSAAVSLRTLGLTTSLATS